MFYEANDHPRHAIHPERCQSNPVHPRFSTASFKGFLPAESPPPGFLFFYFRSSTSCRSVLRTLRCISRLSCLPLLQVRPVPEPVCSNPRFQDSHAQTVYPNSPDSCLPRNLLWARNDSNPASTLRQPVSPRRRSCQTQIWYQQEYCRGFPHNHALWSKYPMPCRGWFWRNLRR